MIRVYTPNSHVGTFRVLYGAPLAHSVLTEFEDVDAACAHAEHVARERPGESVLVTSVLHEFKGVVQVTSVSPKPANPQLETI